MFLIQTFLLVQNCLPYSNFLPYSDFLLFRRVQKNCTNKKKNVNEVSKTKLGCTTLYFLLLTNSLVEECEDVRGLGPAELILGEPDHVVHAAFLQLPATNKPFAFADFFSLFCGFSAL